MRRIRIKKEGGPLYHQNANMSLNQGLVVQKDGEPSIRNTIQESDTPNTEVEKGEVVLKNDNSQLLKVGGKPHYMGGTKVALEPSDFVFSHYLKPGEEIVEMLDGTKKNKSFADIMSKEVKGYNQAIHNLNTTDDQYIKNAATFTAKEVLNKAVKTAFAQELMKGLPNGIPSFIQEQEEDNQEEPMMKKGGLVYMQKAGEKPKSVNRKEYDENLKKGFVPQEDDPFTAVRETPGKQGKSSKNKDFNKTYDYFHRLHPEKTTLKNGKRVFTWRGKEYDANLGTKEVIQYKPDTGEMITSTNQRVQNMPSPKPVPPFIKTPPVENPPSKTPPDRDDFSTWEKPYYDSGYGVMDMVSIMSPYLNPINRYAPIRQKINAPQINPNLVDFTQQRQSIKGMTSTMGRQNALISPNSSVASSRNAQLLGQALNPLAESFSNEFNTNQQIKNQTDVYNAEAQFKANTMNVGFADDYNTKYAQMNENFDARKSLRNAQFLNNWYAAENARINRDAFNYTNPDFQVGANRNIWRINYGQDRMINRITGQPSSKPTLTWKQWYEENTKPGGKWEGMTDMNILYKDFNREVGNQDDEESSFERNRGRALNLVGSQGFRS